MERNAKFQWIFCLLLGCATSLVAQNVANWGLTHPQPKETLPKSKAQIMMPTPKAHALINCFEKLKYDTGGSGGREGWGE